MPGVLTHSPARILASALIQRGLGTAPNTAGTTSWPIHYASEPPTPDAVVTIFDTEGVTRGRTMNDGEQQEKHGVQVRVRAGTHKIGFAKMNALCVAMDQDVYQDFVNIEGSQYRIHCVSNRDTINHLGKDVQTNKLDIFTVNALVTVRKIN